METKAQQQGLLFYHTDTANQTSQPDWHFPFKTLNDSSKPKSSTQQLKQLLHSEPDSDLKFYFLLIAFLILGFFRYYYDRYFENLFRVFFNTSLRQSQLTDQLLQSKFPSLLLNIFFVLMTGFYLFLLIGYYNPSLSENYFYLLLSVLAVFMVYATKYLMLHFFGWLVDLRQEAASYVFIVFLFNKIIGIALLPLSVCFAFKQIPFSGTVVTLSYFIVSGLFLLRYYRTFGFMQHRTRLNGAHFIIYVAAVEVLPIFMMMKWAIRFMAKIN